MRVYLAGTITADPSTHSWRATACEHLRNMGHIPLSPMRRKDPEEISPDGLTSDISPFLFVERDEMDIRSADVMILNALGMADLKRQSIGTWAEMGMARILHMPIIIIATDHDVVKYPFVQKWACSVVPNLGEALDVVYWLAD